MSDCSPSVEAADQSASFHLVIIGSGSAAFACAIKASESGARVTIIERGEIGGCCVNVGCVPSKVMIRGAQLAQLQRSNPFAGLEDHPPVLDRGLLLAQQQSLVDELREAKYEQILANNEAITLVPGEAMFEDGHRLGVTQADGNSVRLSADRILIATGSQAFIPAIDGIDDVPYWTSTEALVTASIPASLLVLGSSVVALELAQAFSRLGSQVTILARGTLLSRHEPQLGEGLKQVFEDEGISVFTDTQASEVGFNAGVFTVEFFDQRRQQHHCLHYEQLLVATGRLANTAQLNLVAAGVSTDKQGRVVIDDHCRTSAADIYAAGDCSTMPQFVYVAAAAGTRAAINMGGGNATLELAVMPAVIFTEPQVATVGLTESQARLRGISPQSRTLAIHHVPRALVNVDSHGSIQIVINSQTRQIIGAHLLAGEAGEMIQVMALAISNKMLIEELAGQLFPYLTMVEGLKLCAQTFFKDVSQLSCCAG